MNKRLENHVVLITGGGRGIGQAIALRCAQEGANVALASRTQIELEETARKVEGEGGTALVVPTDVTNYEQVQSLVEQIQSKLGDISLLVNNAGRLGTPGPTWESEPSDWCKDVMVNLCGTYHCCHAVLPGMLQRQAGRIINMVGGGTSTPFPFASAYGSSKAGVMRFTETLALELTQTQNAIKVFALTPGFVKTAMTEMFDETEEGRKWMSGLLERMKQGDHESPELAADMVAEIGSGRFDPLHGRYFNSTRDHDNMDRLEQEIESILNSEKRTLRLVK